MGSISVANCIGTQDVAFSLPVRRHEDDRQTKKQWRWLYTIGLAFNAIARIYGVATSTAMRWVRTLAEKAYKNMNHYNALSLSLTKCGPIDMRKSKLWIWKTYCRDTGQLIDWECGNRDQDILFKAHKEPSFLHGTMPVTGGHRV
jgi:hypothetical protein